MFSFQFVKYLLVGGINTAVTAFTIFGLMYYSIDVYVANAIGYIIGIVVSFVLNSSFTFSQKFQLSRLIKFLVVCGISYLVNIFILKTYFLWDDNVYIAQIFAMCGYTFVGFFLNKFWAMK